MSPLSFLINVRAKNAPFAIPKTPNSLSQIVITQAYLLSEPYIDIVDTKPTKFLKEVSLEVSTYFIIAASMFLKDYAGLDYQIIDAYKDHLYMRLDSELDIHKDARHFYVEERSMVFFKEITALKSNEELYDTTFITALLTKWPLTETDVIEIEIADYKEVGLTLFEPIQLVLFREMLISSIGQLVTTIKNYLDMMLS